MTKPWSAFFASEMTGSEARATPVAQINAATRAQSQADDARGIIAAD
jgi:hypothetical protein